MRGVGVAGIVGLGLAACGAVVDARPADLVARLRPATSFERRVIAEGLCESATFRSLVDRLRKSDLIVYVSMRRLGNRHLYGRLDFLGASATERVLRAAFTFPLDRASRIAVLGHELQHAVEVADAPEVRNARAFDAYFRSHGQPAGIESAYDTDTARRTELRIREELATSGACATGR